jgi:hypothetical protein
MNAAVWVGIIWLAAVILAGVALTVTAPRWARPDRLLPLRRRLAVASDGLAGAFGAPLAGLFVVLFGIGLMMVSLWLLGELAQVLEPAIDVPVFHWFEARQVEPWSSWWWFLTDIGKVDVTQRLAAVAAVVFAVLFARRRWWAPPALLLFGFISEKLVQEWVKVIVDRGHPPTTLGTWPSGGCARVLIVYGLIVFLALRYARVRSTRVWVAGWSLVALAETVQAYARTYNLEHWVTDVVGGVIFGIMLLLMMLAVAAIILPAEDDRPPAGDAGARDRAEPTPQRELVSD